MLSWTKDSLFVVGCVLSNVLNMQAILWLLNMRYLKCSNNHAIVTIQSRVKTPCCHVESRGCWTHSISLQYKLVKFSYKQIALCIQSIKHKPIKNYATSSSYVHVVLTQHSMGHFQTLSLTCLCMHETVGHLLSKLSVLVHTPHTSMFHSAWAMLQVFCLSIS